MSMPRWAFTVSTAFLRIVRFDRPRKSNFRRPRASMACISYWVMSESELVAFWSGMSSVSGSPPVPPPAPGGDTVRAHPPGRVRRRVAGHALELLGELDDPLDAVVGVVLLAQLGADLEGLLEPDP